MAILNAARDAANFIANQAEQTVSSIDRAIKDTLSFGNDPANFASSLRSKNIPGETGTTSRSTASFASPQQDWRVRLDIPNIQSFQQSPILQPLVETNGLVFPFTPTIIIGQSANYNALQPVHTNYPYYNYENSQIDNLVISGEFFVETSSDAAYWVAMLHYLRSMTKMFYGEGENLGNPPPLTRLNGYGDYIFKNVPVAITNFTVDLQSEVDYIGVDLAGANGSTGTTGGKSWAPTQSLVSITCLPMYARKTTSKFSLDAFVRGDYIVDGKGFI